jgi:hypothetical protein
MVVVWMIMLPSPNFYSAMTFGFGVAHIKFLECF